MCTRTTYQAAVEEIAGDRCLDNSASDDMQVPTLETPEGGVFESNAIARYVARLADTGLFGTTLLDTVGCPR
jgi:Glutathione S-transferase, N-terminal domain